MNSAREREGAVGASGDVALETIERDRVHVLDALFELYAHDFSEHVPLVLQESGRFGVSAGEVWWTRDDHHPFFVRVAGRLAGFALVRRGSRIADDPEVMDVAEFFVVRGERGQSVGQQAARLLLDRFPGRWEVRVRHSNGPALKFWSRVLARVAAGTVHTSTRTISEVGWHVLRTESGAASAERHSPS